MCLPVQWLPDCYEVTNHPLIGFEAALWKETQVRYCSLSKQPMPKEAIGPKKEFTTAV